MTDDNTIADGTIIIEEEEARLDHSNAKTTTEIDDINLESVIVVGHEIVPTFSKTRKKHQHKNYMIAKDLMNAAEVSQEINQRENVMNQIINQKNINAAEVVKYATGKQFHERDQIVVRVTGISSRRHSRRVTIVKYDNCLKNEMTKDHQNN